MGDWSTDQIRAVDSGDASRVAQAMNAVLAEEVAASAAIEACQGEVTRALGEARLAARARIERAEALAQAIHARTERIATQRAESLVAASTTPSPVVRPLAAVVDEIAAWLAGDAGG